MHLAAGHFPDQPTLDGSEEQFSSLRPFPSAIHVVQNPLNLRPAEIGIDNQAGFAANHLLVSLFLQCLRIIRGSPALPHDGVVNRLPGNLVPHHRGLPLVGNSQSHNIPIIQIVLQHCLLGYRNLRCPDLRGIVLHPALFRKILGKLPLRRTDGVALLIVNHATGTGRPLVHRHDVFLHLSPHTFPEPDVTRTAP